MISIEAKLPIVVKDNIPHHYTANLHGHASMHVYKIPKHTQIHTMNLRLCILYNFSALPCCIKKSGVVTIPKYPRSCQLGPWNSICDLRYVDFFIKFKGPGRRTHTTPLRQGVSSGWYTREICIPLRIIQAAVLILAWA